MRAGSQAHPHAPATGDESRSSRRLSFRGCLRNKLLERVIMRPASLTNWRERICTVQGCLMGRCLLPEMGWGRSLAPARAACRSLCWRLLRRVSQTASGPRQIGSPWEGFRAARVCNRHARSLRQRKSSTDSEHRRWGC